MQKQLLVFVTLEFEEESTINNNNVEFSVQIACYVKENYKEEMDLISFKGSNDFRVSHIKTTIFRNTCSSKYLLN